MDKFRDTKLMISYGRNQIGGIKLMVLGSIVPGLDEEDLERLMRIHQWFVSISVDFSLIHVLGLFPSSLCTFA
jgi:hypothetical protein